MLKAEGLNAFYGTVQALHGVSLKVGRGEIVTLLGPNGAGKSTTLRVIMGLMRQRQGAIYYQGQRIDGLRPDRRVSLGISLVPEGRALFPEMTVRENLELGAYTRRNERSENEALIEQVYTIFPILKERHRQLAGTMSGGQQQMLAIGRALMSRPQLLLLDEPSLGLAPQLVELVLESIVQINKDGTTVLLVEQNANLALSISKHCYIMESGRIAFEGESKDLFDSEEIRNAYFGVV